MTYSSGGLGPASVLVADVNGDRKLDVLMANYCADAATCPTYNAVGVLLGNGDGTFQTPRSYSLGGSNPVSIAVADLNGDGKPDLLVGSVCADSTCSPGSSIIEVLQGNGDGTFQTIGSYASGGYVAESLAVGDVNGDGRLDLLGELVSAKRRVLRWRYRGLVR